MTEIDDLLTSAGTVVLAQAAAYHVAPPGPPLTEGQTVTTEAYYPGKFHTVYRELYATYNRAVEMYRHLADLAGIHAVLPLVYDLSTSMVTGITEIQTSCTAMEADYSNFAGLLDAETGHSLDHLEAQGDKLMDLITAANEMAKRLTSCLDSL